MGWGAAANTRFDASSTASAVITRPRRINEAAAAAVGAVAMLGFGILSPAQALATLGDQWNLFLFFLGLMFIASLADAAGFLDAAGALAEGAARAVAASCCSRCFWPALSSRPSCPTTQQR